MSSKNREIVRYAIEEVFNQKNAELLVNLYATEFRGDSPFGPIEGRDGFRVFFRNFVAAFPDFHIALERIIADEDWVVVSYGFTGTNTGRFNGLPATGCVVECRGVALTRVAGNRIVEQSFVWDNLAPRRQVRQALMAAQRLSQLSS
jgi:steroid delta-isomerase-like uncharacterized protein